MRLAYADPPYPGKAHLYADHPDYAGEVDHAELIGRLADKYDGWALSTHEPTLALVLALCPSSTRVLTWCKTDAPPRKPYPWFSTEFVLCVPARVGEHAVRSYYAGPAPPRGFCGDGSLIGAKTKAFCDWIIQCLGATTDDTLDDVFPGTGVMGMAWESFLRQRPLWVEGAAGRSWGGQRNILRRTHEPLPGFDRAAYHKESWR